MVPGFSYGQQFTAAQTAEVGVRTLLSAVAESRPLFLSNRDAYFAAVEEVLNSFVDFSFIFFNIFF